ncbi:3653_t:CDS:2 [Gigaspora margarita]|uniref:3653_t:CDS:1 n=1 Tax=Gigaspora margarita TaxID=4874 RepID=A0ABN7VZX1_GIGMA|nr:3653_t:CDS:2 [Gigaspora margarita]
MKNVMIVDAPIVEKAIAKIEESIASTNIETKAIMEISDIAKNDNSINQERILEDSLAFFYNSVNTADNSDKNKVSEGFILVISKKKSKNHTKRLINETNKASFGFTPRSRINRF